MGTLIFIGLFYKFERPNVSVILSTVSFVNQRRPGRRQPQFFFTKNIVLDHPPPIPLNPLTQKKLENPCDEYTWEIRLIE